MDFDPTTAQPEEDTTAAPQKAARGAFDPSTAKIFDPTSAKLVEDKPAEPKKQSGIVRSTADTALDLVDMVIGWPTAMVSEAAKAQALGMGAAARMTGDETQTPEAVQRSAEAIKQKINEAATPSLRKALEYFGYSKDAPASGVAQAMNKVMEVTDKGGEYVEKATGGAVKKEIVSTLRDELMTYGPLLGALPNTGRAAMAEEMAGNQAALRGSKITKALDAGLTPSEIADGVLKKAAERGIDTSAVTKEHIQASIEDIAAYYGTSVDRRTGARGPQSQLQALAKEAPMVEEAAKQPPKTMPTDRLWEVKFADRNAEPVPELTVAEMKQSIQQKGITDPVTILVSTKDNLAFLSDGNHRVAAARDMNMPDVPVRIERTSRSFSDEVKAKAKHPDYLGLTKEQIDAAPETATFEKRGQVNAEEMDFGAFQKDYRQEKAAAPLENAKVSEVVTPMAKVGLAPEMTGVHFSQAQRELLSGKMFGSGINAEESYRIKLATDPRIKSRISFYVDEGHGVTPEVGVGAYRHEVPLNNLYDGAKNPLKLSTDAYVTGQTAGPDFNRFESAVLDAGFDGYYIRAAHGKQGGAVLLGKAAEAVKVMPKNSDTLINVGLNTNDGVGITRTQVEAALRDMDILVVKGDVHASNTEPTFAAKITRPLTPEEANKLSVTLKQEAIVQVHNGKGELYGPQAKNWGPFNPDYFLRPDGKKLNEGFLGQAFKQRGAIGNLYTRTLPEAMELATKMEGEVGKRTTRGWQVTAPMEDKAVMNLAPEDRVNLAKASEEVYQSNYFNRVEKVSPALKEWFGASQVVDAQGNPKTAYHGTSRDFTSFDEAATKTTNAFDSVGLYFTKNPEDASGFAGTQTGANVRPVYLDIRKPAAWERVADSLGLSPKIGPSYLTKEMVSALKSRGYDGIVWRDGEEIVAFNSAQVHSVFAPKRQMGVEKVSPALKEWFGASQVVDAQGNPKTVYHGTQAAFDKHGRRPDSRSAFERFTDMLHDKGLIKKPAGYATGLAHELGFDAAWGAVETAYGKQLPRLNQLDTGAIWATGSPELAAEYAATSRGGNAAPNIRPEHLKIERPVTLDFHTGTLYLPDGTTHTGVLKDLSGYWNEANRIGLAFAKKYNADGVIIKGVKDSPLPRARGSSLYAPTKPQDIFIVFKSEQLRSVFDSDRPASKPTSRLIAKSQMGVVDKQLIANAGLMLGGAALGAIIIPNDTTDGLLLGTAIGFGLANLPRASKAMSGNWKSSLKNVAIGSAYAAVGAYVSDDEHPVEGAILASALFGVRFLKKAGPHPEDDLANAYYGNRAAEERLIKQVGDAKRTAVPDKATRGFLSEAAENGKFVGRTPQERAVIDAHRSMTNSYAQLAKNEGVKMGFIENYVSHILESKGLPQSNFQAAMQNLMGGSRSSGGGARFTKERALPTFADLRKALANNPDLQIKTMDIAEIGEIYSRAMTRTIEQHKLLRNLTDAVDHQGQPYNWIVDKPAPGYVQVSTPQLRGKYISPDIAPSIEFIFDPRRHSQPAEALFALNRATKRCNVYGTFFHAGSLITSFALAGGDVFHVKGALDAGVKLYQEAGLGSRLDKLQRNGLRLPMPEDISPQALTQVGQLADALTNKLMPTANSHLATKVLGKAEYYQQTIFDKFTWDYVGVGTKVSTAMRLMEEFDLKKDSNGAFKGMNEDQYMQAVSSHVNKTFGGLDWYKVVSESKTDAGRQAAMALFKPASRDWLGVAAFAPDWGVSTMRAMADALPGGSKNPVNTMLARRYAIRTAALYAVVLNTMNYVYTGHNMWDNKDPLRMELGNGLSIQFVKHAAEYGEWVTQPTKTFSNKMGFFPRGGMVALTGKQYPGGPAIEGSKLGYMASQVAPFTARSFTGETDPSTGATRSLLGLFSINLYGHTEEERAIMREERKAQREAKQFDESTAK